jgi:hypothetical protein
MLIVYKVHLMKNTVNTRKKTINKVSGNFSSSKKCCWSMSLKSQSSAKNVTKSKNSKEKGAKLMNS